MFIVQRKLTICSTLLKLIARIAYRTYNTIKIFKINFAAPNYITHYNNLFKISFSFSPFFSRIRDGTNMQLYLDRLEAELPQTLIKFLRFKE